MEFKTYGFSIDKIVVIKAEEKATGELTHLTMSIEEAEALVKMLQESIESAKED